MMMSILQRELQLRPSAVEPLVTPIMATAAVELIVCHPTRGKVHGHWQVTHYKHTASECGPFEFVLCSVAKASSA
jgi:hypothetical protein